MGQSNPFGGALTMAAFGAGTAPGLPALGLGVSMLPAVARRWNRPVSAAATAVLGVVLLWRGLAPIHLHCPSAAEPRGWTPSWTPAPGPVTGSWFYTCFRNRPRLF